jgi:hypothetical protein
MGGHSFRPGPAEAGPSVRFYRMNCRTGDAESTFCGKTPLTACPGITMPGDYDVSGITMLWSSGKYGNRAAKS